MALDRQTAAQALDLLRDSPERPDLLKEVEAVLSSFPADAELVTRGCDALLQRAQMTAPDEPPLPDGPAALCAAVAQRCLEAQPKDADPLSVAYLRMAAANGLRLSREFDAAEQGYLAALEVAPERGGWWFNLGLLHKARGDWAKGLEANREARSRLGDERAVLWNLAICATALGDGDRAVEALRPLGFDARVAESGMPVVDGLPPAQVRTASTESGWDDNATAPDRSVGFETLWVQPLSPCHGVVQSAGWRTASIDYGDLVLWDGTPVGVADHGGRRVPRFPVLARLRQGDERRFRFAALQQSAGQVEALVDGMPGGSHLFVLRERIEQMCSRCASGDHMRKHEHTAPEAHRVVYGKIIVEAEQDLAGFRKGLDDLLAKHDELLLVSPELLESVGDTRAAGKAHQLWRAVSNAAR